MKKFITTLLVCLTILPLTISASEKKYETMNLKEVLTSEEIEHDLSNYKETNDQITIYLFRGSGCGYCKSFLNYLNSIVDEYGKYFKLVSYEVRSNTENSELMQKAAQILGDQANGVPYIIIGDKSFLGYSSKYNESIQTAIKDLYESDDRYDILEEIEKKDKEEEKANKPTTNIPVIIWDAVFVAIATLIIVLLNNNKTSELQTKLDEIDAKLNALTLTKQDVAKENPTKTAKSTKTKSKSTKKVEK